MARPINPTSLDHVALWVDEREQITEFACGHLGMHVIEKSDAFTLVGVDAREGKITLFDAEGPRRPGALEHIALRVENVAAAIAGLPQSAAVRRCEDGSARLEAPGGVPLALVRRGGIQFDLDHVVLRLPDRDSALEELADLGFERRNGSLVVGGRELRVLEGTSSDDDRPLLNHIALLVDSAEDVQREAQQRGLEIDDVKDAPNTLAVFLRGPAGVRIEYVEHKPGFALV